MKFRRGGKTLVTLYARDGFFIVSIVLGKVEREVFDYKRSEFSETMANGWGLKSAMRH